MDERLREKSCESFTEALASPAPVPGGGGASALTGALCAALCAMTAKLSEPRAKDPATIAALKAAAEKAECLRKRQLKLIDADAEAFLPLSRAYSIPKDAPGRAEKLRELSLQAAAAPLEMLRLCGEAAEVLEELLESAGPLLLSDVGCAACLCRAAVECAAMNVLVNTRTYREDKRALAYEREVEALRKELLRRTDAVAEAVMEGLVS